MSNSTAIRFPESTEKRSFRHEEAFSRSLGLVTRDELRALKGKTVAIAGMGGVGGSHLLTLTRLGIGGFHLADFDRFGIENFNRQAGANLATIGRPKVDVLAEMALNINPELRIKKFDAGLRPENVNEFFNGVDLYVDSLDFFAFEARALVSEHCAQHRIPIITAGPIGIGVAHLNFLPGGISMVDYFQWKKSDSLEDLGVKFLIGLSPTLRHMNHVADPSFINLVEKKGPSVPMACEMCAGIAGSEALKILLQRGRVYTAPHVFYFDAYANQLLHRRVWWGNRNPLQRLKIAIARRILRKMLAAHSNEKS